MIERNKHIDQPEPNENHDLGFKFMKRKHKKAKMAVVDVELDEIEADYESENARFEEIFGSSADSLRSIISKL